MNAVAWVGIEATMELVFPRVEPVESVIERVLLGHCVAEVVYDCR